MGTEIQYNSLPDRGIIKDFSKVPVGEIVVIPASKIHELNDVIRIADGWYVCPANLLSNHLKHQAQDNCLDLCYFIDHITGDYKVYFVPKPVEYSGRTVSFDAF